jgi:fructan beta-fructosidase
MNDPNGMVFYKGEYHLFYQHYPDGNTWGPMHWGHAVSVDLVHWQHLPIGIFPDSLGMIFSGSIVVDHQNVTGFGTANDPPLIAIYTSHDMTAEKSGRNDYQNQSMAYSNDRGRTWTKFNDNPVLKNPGTKDFRDPKVFWHSPSKAWIMILAVGNHVELYRSTTLTSWTKLSEFGIDQGGHGGVWECPDLFPLKVGDGEDQKWVMLVSLGDGGINGGSGTQYFVGDFDGTTFTNDNPKDKILWLDYGRDNYAGVTWSNIPESDGRTIFIGWMSNWKYANVVPTEVWRSANTLPRTLQLQQSAEGLRLVSLPVKEFYTLALKSEEVSGKEITDSLDLSSSLTELSTYLLDIEISGADQSGFVIELENEVKQKVLFGYSPQEGNRFYLDRNMSGKNDYSINFPGKHYAPRVLASPDVKLKMIVDRSSIEVFVDGGLTVFTDLVFPDKVFSKLKIKSQGKVVKLASAKVTAIDTIWE